MSTIDELPPWADPNSPGNKIRPRVRCLGCGKPGCVTFWGNWCFECNVARMTRLTAAFDNIAVSIRQSSSSNE